MPLGVWGEKAAHGDMWAWQECQSSIRSSKLCSHLPQAMHALPQLTVDLRLAAVGALNQHRETRGILHRSLAVDTATCAAWPPETHVRLLCITGNVDAWPGPLCPALGLIGVRIVWSLWVRRAPSQGSNDETQWFFWGAGPGAAVGDAGGAAVVAGGLPHGADL